MSALRPALLAWLLIAAVSASLAAHARLEGPPGTVFSGAFYYVDDFYNYLGSVEQAQRGAILLRSKLASPAGPALLLNLEWLAVGRLAALLGNDPVAAYQAFGLLALLALAWLADRWLVRSGLPPCSRLPGLLLVLTGGGAGGLLYLARVLPGERALDLRTGAFPFVEAIGNPHFLAGTTLLLAALSAFAAERPWTGAGLGVALSLVRPYDAALLVAVEASATAILRPRQEWTRRAAPLALAASSLAYPFWLFTAAPGFRAFSSSAYSRVAPAGHDVLLALAPALLLAATALRAWGQAEGRQRGHLLRLALWAGIAVLLAVARPVSFGLQFMVGAGLPLLALAAVGLAAVSRRLLLLALPALASSAVVATWLCTIPTPASHPQAERWLVARALRDVCRPGEVVLSPPDIGLFAGGLSPCWPVLSHPAAPGYEETLRAAAAFYRRATAPSQRAAMLEQFCPDHLVLPRNVPPGWLGSADFQRRDGDVLQLPTFVVWTRNGPRCGERARGDFR